MLDPKTNGLLYSLKERSAITRGALASDGGNSTDLLSLHFAFLNKIEQKANVARKTDIMRVIYVNMSLIIKMFYDKDEFKDFIINVKSSLSFYQIEIFDISQSYQALIYFIIC